MVYVQIRNICMHIELKYDVEHLVSVTIFQFIVFMD